MAIQTKLTILSIKGGLPGGVNLYRLDNHADLLRQAGHTVLTPDVKEVEALAEWGIAQKPDIIHTNLDTSIPKLGALCYIREKTGAKLVVDYDDHNQAVPDYNQASPWTHKNTTVAKVWRAYLKEADATTCTTQTLADLAGLPSYVLPNFVKPEWFDGPAKEHKEVRVIFTGASAGRYADLKFIEPLARWMGKEHPTAKLVLTGVMPDWGLDMPWVYLAQWCEAPRFFKLLRYINPDIGLAPLAFNDFNRGKSAIKYYEYAMVGAAGIYQNIEPYFEVRHMESGKVSGIKVDDWIWYLDSLIRNPSGRSATQACAKMDVMENHTSAPTVEVFESIMNGVPADAHCSRRPRKPKTP